MIKAIAVPGKSLLTPSDHPLILIDSQSQLAFATQTIDIPNLRSNSDLICKAARRQRRRQTPRHMTTFQHPHASFLRSSVPFI